jgi:Ribbon-helix-helix domain
MSRKKISTTIYVTPEQSEKLKLLHERTKVPVAVYIREGIDLVLRHYSSLLPGQLPLDGGRSEQRAERPGTGTFGRTIATSGGPTNGGPASGGAGNASSGADPNDSDDVERDHGTLAGGGSLGGHAAHAASKK